MVALLCVNAGVRIWRSKYAIDVGRANTTAFYRLRQAKQAQDANLDMLLEWISQYPTRDDAFCASAHQELFTRYPGKKTRLTDNPSRLVL
jgi:hypothetical protein